MSLTAFSMNQERYPWTAIDKTNVVVVVVVVVVVDVCGISKESNFTINKCLFQHPHVRQTNL